MKEALVITSQGTAAHSRRQSPTGRTHPTLTAGGTVHRAGPRRDARRRQSWSARGRRRILPILGALALITGCSGDPYERYGAVVHEDVDAAMVAAFRMTARAQ